MPGPRAVLILLSETDRGHLEKTVHQQTAPQKVLRSRILMFAAEGLSNALIAAHLHCGRATVVRWRGRFAQSGLAGLADEPRPGRPRSCFPAAAHAQRRQLREPGRSRRQSPALRWLLQRLQSPPLPLDPHRTAKGHPTAPGRRGENSSARSAASVAQGLPSLAQSAGGGRA
ncbi:helix-turn-helix domain-containing protein [bacterium]|nr:helix-turn-helix domain-containing protein [bacterium]